jgi:hypothetical protein
MFIGALSGAILAGCAPSGVHIPNVAFHISKCTTRASAYPVADVGKHKRAACDLVGQALVFPNGYTVTAPPIGSTDSYVDGSGPGATNSYLVANFGTLGIVAGERNVKTGVSTWWGTTSGISRYQAGFGKNVPDGN